MANGCKLVKSVTDQTKRCKVTQRGPERTNTGDHYVCFAQKLYSPPSLLKQMVCICLVRKLLMHRHGPCCITWAIAPICSDCCMASKGLPGHQHASAMHTLPTHSLTLGTHLHYYSPHAIHQPCKQLQGKCNTHAQCPRSSTVRDSIGASSGRHCTTTGQNLQLCGHQPNTKRCYHHQTKRGYFATSPPFCGELQNDPHRVC